jgi:hypothetical protein
MCIRTLERFWARAGVRTATELATRLLHEAHVVTVPGEAFGTAEHIRISYPVTKQNIDEGTRRMGEFPGQAGLADIVSQRNLERARSGILLKRGELCIRRVCGRNVPKEKCIGHCANVWFVGRMCFRCRSQSIFAL